MHEIVKVESLITRAIVETRKTRATRISWATYRTCGTRPWQHLRCNPATDFSKTGAWRRRELVQDGYDCWCDWTSSPSPSWGSTRANLFCAVSRRIETWPTLLLLSSMQENGKSMQWIQRWIVYRSKSKVEGLNSQVQKSSLRWRNSSRKRKRLSIPNADGKKQSARKQLRLNQ